MKKTVFVTKKLTVKKCKVIYVYWSEISTLKIGAKSRNALFCATY